MDFSLSPETPLSLTLHFFSSLLSVCGQSFLLSINSVLFFFFPYCSCRVLKDGHIGLEFGWLWVGWIERRSGGANWRLMSIAWMVDVDSIVGLGFALIFCYGYSVYLQVYGGGGGGLLWWWWRWVH